MSSPARNDARKDIAAYVTGFALALILTTMAFAAVYRPALFGRQTLATVFSLGLLQAIVHFRYFLHVKLTRSSRDDLFLLLFSTLIITLMVAGTLVLLGNLRMRMT